MAWGQFRHIEKEDASVYGGRIMTHVSPECLEKPLLRMFQLDVEITRIYDIHLFYWNRVEMIDENQIVRPLKTRWLYKVSYSRRRVATL